jgi:hypothetical protein
MLLEGMAMRPVGRVSVMLGHGKEGGRKEGDMVFKGVVMRVVSKKGVCSLSAWQ